MERKAHATGLIASERRDVFGRPARAREKDNAERPFAQAKGLSY